MHSQMPVAKKRVTRLQLATSVIFQDPNCWNSNILGPPGSGFFITDILSAHKFLVDTGTFRSVFPATAEDRKHPFKQPTNIKLIAANGSTIPIYGTRPAPNQAAECSFTWDFIIADFKTSLLGVDFLSHYRLVVDVANQKLQDVATFCSTSLGFHRWSTEICSVRTDTPYNILCQEFPEIFRPELCQKRGPPAKHEIFHHIKITDPIKLQVSTPISREATSSKTDFRQHGMDRHMSKSIKSMDISSPCQESRWNLASLWRLQVPQLSYGTRSPRPSQHSGSYFQPTWGQGFHQA